MQLMILRLIACLLPITNALFKMERVEGGMKEGSPDYQDQGPSLIGHHRQTLSKTLGMELSGKEDGEEKKPVNEEAAEVPEREVLNQDPDPSTTESPSVQAQQSTCMIKTACSVLKKPLPEMAKFYLDIGLASISDTTKVCLPQADPDAFSLATILLKTNLTLWGSMKIGISKVIRNDFRQIIVWISGPEDLEKFTKPDPEGKLGVLNSQHLVTYHPYCHDGAHVGNLIRDAYKAAYTRHLKTHIVKLFDKYASDSSIMFAGHSIGGCVAQMAAMSTIKEIKWDSVHFMGYSMPRCGDQNYAAKVDQLLPDSWNVYWEDDVIVNYPKKTDAASELSGAKLDKARPKDQRSFFHAKRMDTLSYDGTNVKQKGMGQLTNGNTNGKPENHYGFFGNQDPRFFSYPIC